MLNAVLVALALAADDGYAFVDFRDGPEALAGFGLDLAAIAVGRPAAVAWTRHGLGVRSDASEDRLAEIEIMPNGAAETLSLSFPVDACAVAGHVALLFAEGEVVREDAEIRMVGRDGRDVAKIRLEGRGRAPEHPRKLRSGDGEPGVVSFAYAAPPGEAIRSLRFTPVDGPRGPEWRASDPPWGPDHSEFVLRSVSWSASCGDVR